MVSDGAMASFAHSVALRPVGGGVADSYATQLGELLSDFSHELWGIVQVHIFREPVLEKTDSMRE